MRGVGVPSLKQEINVCPFLMLGARDIPAVASLLDKVLDKASKLAWEMPKDLPRCEVRRLFIFFSAVFETFSQLLELCATFKPRFPLLFDSRLSQNAGKKSQMDPHRWYLLKKGFYQFCFLGICKTTAAL